MPYPDEQGDFKSLAWSLLPAAVGALAGGPGNRVGGGALGMASGLVNAENSRLAVDKANADIIYKNAQIQEGQQRIELARKNQLLAEQQEARLGRAADYAARESELQLRQLGRLEQIDVRTQAGQESLRNTLSDQDRLEFDADPDKKGWIDAYRLRKRDEAKLAGAGPLLESLGFKDGEKWKNILGPTGIARAFEIKAMEESDVRKAKAADRRPVSHVIGDQIVVYDPIEKKFVPTEIESPRLSSQRRIAAENAAIKQRFGNDALPGQAEKYLNSIEGRMHIAYLSGELPREGYEQVKTEISQASIKAKDEMFEAWKAVNQGKNLTKELTRKDLDAYLETEEGAANFESWKRAKLGGRINIERRKPAQSGQPLSGPAPQTFNTLPPAAQFKGKKAVGDDGQELTSDGTNWRDKSGKVVQ